MMNTNKNDFSLIQTKKWNLIYLYKSKNELQNTFYKKCNDDDNKEFMDFVLDSTSLDSGAMHHNDDDNSSNLENNSFDAKYRRGPQSRNIVPCIRDAPSDEHEKLMKAENKRLRWNEYMRNYNAKKRRELNERLTKVPIMFKNTVQLYDVNDINEILNNYINLFECLYNNNVNRFNPILTNEINDNDVVKYSKLLQSAITPIIND